VDVRMRKVWDFKILEGFEEFVSFERDKEGILRVIS